MFNMFKKKRPLAQRKIVGYIAQGTQLEAWADDYLTTVTISTLQKHYNFCAMLDENNTLVYLETEDKFLNTMHLTPESQQKLIDIILWNEQNGNPIIVVPGDTVHVVFHNPDQNTTDVLMGVVNRADAMDSFWYIDMTVNTNGHRDNYYWNQYEQGGMLHYVNNVEVVM